MRTWGFLLGGLIVWAAHFFLLYAIASVFPGQDLPNWLILLSTIAAVAADSALLWAALLLRLRGLSDPFRSWTTDLGAAGAALSLVAVIWQSLPALIG